MAEGPNVVTTVKSWNLGWILALVVLLLCAVAWFNGATLSAWQALALITMLALARLL